MILEGLWPKNHLLIQGGISKIILSSDKGGRESEIRRYRAYEVFECPYFRVILYYYLLIFISGYQKRRI